MLRDSERAGQSLEHALLVSLFVRRWKALWLWVSPLRSLFRSFSFLSLQKSARRFQKVRILFSSASVLLRILAVFSPLWWNAS